ARERPESAPVADAAGSPQEQPHRGNGGPLMPLGRREPVHFPETYKGFRLVRTHGRFFGIPGFLGATDLGSCLRLLPHPAVLSAATLREVEALIDAGDGRRDEPEGVATYEGYDLVRHRRGYYGVPRS